MNLPAARMLVVIILAYPLGIARGQAVKATPAKKPTGFELAPPKSTAVEPAVVVEAPPKAEAVIEYELGTESEPSEAYLGCTAGIEKVEVRSDRRIRWTFYVMNASDKLREVLLDMKAIYLADAKGESYTPVASEYPRGAGGVPFYRIRAGTRFQFWLEYDEPKKPTRQFLVGIVPEQHFSRTFKPFKVELPKSVGTGVEYGKGTGKGTEPPAKDALSPAIRDFYDKGLSYEGNAQLKTARSGQVKTEKVTLAFEAIPGEGNALRARMTDTRVLKLGEVLPGRIIEQGGKAGGLDIILIGADGTVCRLAVQKKSVTGTDTNGWKYTLSVK